MIGLLYNPISGRGRAHRIAHEFACALREQKHEVLLAPVQSSDADQFWNRKQECAVIFGGDGTLRHSLTRFVASGTTGYFVPCGGESLAAKWLKTDRSFETFYSAFRRGGHRLQSLASVNGEYFMTMLSFGLDSRVVHRIHQSRTSSLTRWGYLLPTLSEALSFSAPSFSLFGDGQTFIEGSPGYLIFANTPGYAGGLCFVPEARETSPQLRARFFPNAGIRDALQWSRAFLFRGEIDRSRSQIFQAEQYTLHVQPQSFPGQVDGDPFVATDYQIRAGVAEVAFFSTER